MKQGIHPTYFPQAKIICACGKSTIVGSTVEEIRVEVCSHCHPFYTGKQKLVDTARRVEKFEARKAHAATQPKPKKARVRKPRVEPLKPLGRAFTAKMKIKPADAKSKKPATKSASDKPAK